MNEKNKKDMFDFAMEQYDEWKKTRDDVDRVAFMSARVMIDLAGLSEEWKKYVANRKEKKC